MDLFFFNFPLGLAWPGLAWLGLAWPGLAWPGRGEAWPGLAWPRCRGFVRPAFLAQAVFCFLCILGPGAEGLSAQLSWPRLVGVHGPTPAGPPMRASSSPGPAS